jgi:hypothetical protein
MRCDTTLFNSQEIYLKQPIVFLVRCKENTLIYKNINESCIETRILGRLTRYEDTQGMKNSLSCLLFYFH